jgi:protocatechuate 3,4-dioxygenase beta subunit
MVAQRAPGGSYAEPMSARQRFDEEHSADVVAASFDDSPDPRLRQVLQSLVRHLHDFVKEVELTDAEWAEAIDFLTRTGHKSDDLRQEFVLLSDVLGISMLVETINHRASGEATESTVLGPFHVLASPRLEPGAQLSRDGNGEPCLVTGRVTAGGRPLANATVDVWQADADGLYDVQRPEVPREGNLRGLFTCGRDGQFWFRTIVPKYYPIPDDGPVGELLHATGRHPYRPAHIHFLVEAAGHRPLTTHLFVAGSPYLDSDAVFGVKAGLVREFELVDDPSRADQVGLANPFRTVHFDVSLLPA